MHPVKKTGQILVMFLTAVLCQAQPNTNHVTNDEAIRQTTSHFSAAWNQADAQAVAEVFSEDADLVIPQGLMMNGRSAIAKFYARVFANGYAGSEGTAAVKQIKMVREDLAIVDGEWSITGAHDASGNIRPPERGIFCALVERQSDKWVIRALRETSGAEHIQQSR